MKKLIYSVISFNLILGLAACSNQPHPSMMVARPGVQTLRAQQPSGPARSNAVLDAVSKRGRFVMFQTFDRNRDNQIAPQELGYPNVHIPTFDKNKDGQLNFSEFDQAMLKTKGSGLNRETLRQQAQMMWQQINKDNNTVLLRSEIEEYFTAPYNNPPPMPVPPMPIPSATSDISSDPAAPPAPPVYGDPYGNPYPAPNYEQLKYEARKQAIDFFVQTDVNLDQKLSFSEYEDGYAKQMLSSAENSLSNNYPYYYPYPGMGYGTGYGGGYGSAYPAYPAAARR